MNKNDFIHSFFDDKVTDFVSVQINLDITDLSVADILRNINKSYPINSRDRNKITDGEMIISIICKSEFLEPLSGLLLFITNDDFKLKRDIISKNYMVIMIDEANLKSSEGIKYITDILLNHLCSNYKDELSNLKSFYSRYIYNEDELYDDE